MSEYKNLTIEIDAPSAVLYINRPEVFNALNDQTVSEIGQAITELEKNEEVRGVIITGAALPQKEGKPQRHSFISGADINELAKQSVLSGKGKSLLGQAVLNQIQNCSKPVIAAINGFCFGGGFELALACHWRYASQHAQIGLTECSLGIIPGYGGTQRLARLIGSGLALEMLTTAERLDAEKALEYGIVNRLVDADELLSFTKSRVEAIAKNAPIAVAYSIEAFNRGIDTTQEEGLRIEADLFGVISSSEDMREGLNAFLEKRAPNFKNC